jgi:Tfp pilus assembly protein PilO
VRTRIIAASVLGFVVVLLLWNQLLFSPAGKDVDKARTRRDDAEQQHTQLQAEKARLEQNKQTQPEVQAQLAKLNAAIPPTPDLEGFLRAAFDVKQKSGVDWVSIAPAEPTPGAGASEIKMTIVIKGGFFQVLDYLNRFEDPANMPRLVVIDSLNLSSASGTTGSTGTSGATNGATSSGAPTLSVTLNARMFTQAAPASTTSGGGTPSTPSTTAPAPTTTAGG